MGDYLVEFLHRPPAVDKVRRVPALVDEMRWLSKSIIIEPLLAALADGFNGEIHLRFIASEIVERFGRARDGVHRFIRLPKPVAQIVLVGCESALRVGV